MRLGIFGGSFDPPHIGHLLVATDACEALGLDRILVVPAATQPLKGGAPAVATPEQRLEMTRRTFADDTRFEVSEAEIRRSGLSYTVDTLETVADERKHDDLVLLLGRDAIALFDQWKRPERILELASLAVLDRADTAVPESVMTRCNDVINRSGAKTVTTRRVDVSSTEIRRRVRGGLSVRGFVVESVETYITDEKLYRS